MRSIFIKKTLTSVREDAQSQQIAAHTVEWRGTDQEGGGETAKKAGQRNCAKIQGEGRTSMKNREGEYLNELPSPFLVKLLSIN